MTEEFAIKLQKLHQQIEEESDKVALIQPVIGVPHVNAIRKVFYKMGATPYGEKLLEAEQRAERYEKALTQLKLFAINCLKHLTQPDGLTILRSIDEALTPKQTTDE